MIDVGALFEAHADDIRRYVQRQLSPADAHLAEDFVATVFERVLRNVDSYEDRGRPPKAWLYRIARNLIIDHMRRTRPTEELTEQTRVVANDGADHHDTVLDVRAALGHLKPTQRAVLTERFLNGRSTAETATLFGSTEDAVKKMQSRGLANLRRIWELPVQIQTVEHRAINDAARAPESTQPIVLPSIAEAAKWGVATDELLGALEREEREALAAYEAAKERAQHARRAAEAMRRIRAAVSMDGGPLRRPAALPIVVPKAAVSTASAPSGRWSRAHDACTKCHRTEVKHAARGLCFTCYSKASKSIQGAAS